MKFFTVENSTSPASAQNVTNNNVISPSVGRKQILFEKSATYFDNEVVPRRTHALLPRAKIVSGLKKKLNSVQPEPEPKLFPQQLVLICSVNFFCVRSQS